MSKQIRVLNFLPIPVADQARIAAVSPRIQFEHHAGSDVKTLADPDVEVLVANWVPELAKTPRLRWLQLGSAGVDHVIKSAQWDHRLLVTNARGVYAVPLAEYVITAILSANQKVDSRRAAQNMGRWADEVEYEARGLRGTTALIVGYGTTGREVARLATALGMRVLAVKAQPEVRRDSSFRLPGTGDHEGKLPELIGGLKDLPKMAREADYLVLTLALTSKSRGLITRRVLEALPSRAWVVNIARGGVVDEEALIDLLGRGRIAGAWLDVFSKEPLPPDSPLWKLPNVTLTSHVAGGNDRAWSVLTDLVCLNLRRYLRRERLLNLVDPKREY